jgi:hypothetical protein
VLHKLRRNHDRYRGRRRGSVVFVLIRRLLTMGLENLRGGYGQKTARAGSPERKPLHDPNRLFFLIQCIPNLAIAHDIMQPAASNPGTVVVQCERINIVGKVPNENVSFFAALHESAFGP